MNIEPESKNFPRLNRIIRKTRFGIFANNEQPDAWAFYERQWKNNFKQISRSEFEKGVIGNITTAKS